MLGINGRIPVQDAYCGLRIRMGKGRCHVIDRPKPGWESAYTEPWHMEGDAVHMKPGQGGHRMLASRSGLGLTPESILFRTG